MEDETDDVEHEEAPQAGSSASSGTTDNSFLLELDFESIHTSFDDVLAAIDATRSDADTVATDSTSSAFLSRSPSPWDDDYVLVSETGPGQRRREASQESVASSQVVRRPQPHSGIVPPAWRQAMYISTLVWPAQTSHSADYGHRNKPLPPVVSAPRVIRSGASLLARTFSLKRS